MTINVAINGFGRIGRNILRAKYENEEYSDIKIVAINDLGNSETNAHLLQYDTAHGKFRFDVKSEKNKIIVDNSDEISVFSERDPSNLPWKKLKVDVVLECSGVFTSRQTASAHLTAGAKKGAPNASNKTILSFLSEIFKLSPKDTPVLRYELFKEKELAEDRLPE